MDHLTPAVLSLASLGLTLLVMWLTNFGRGRRADGHDRAPGTAGLGIKVGGGPQRHG
jgi:hypothetical protein